MFTVHLQEYLNLIENLNKTKVWRDLRELQSKEIIEIHKIHNINYIVLKKYAIKFLLSKESTKDVKSINCTYNAIKKSAFINQVILNNKNNFRSVDEIIFYYTNETTMICKCNQNTAILYQYKDMNSDVITNEIKRLEAKQNIQIQNLKSKKSIDCSDETKSKNKKKKITIIDYTLNVMQSRNIYILKINNSEIHVILLDLNDTYNALKMEDALDLTYLYLSSLFPSEIKFKFYFIVSDEESKMRIKKEKNKLNMLLQKKHYIDAFTMQVKNINIRAKLFNNVKILL